MVLLLLIYYTDGVLILLLIFYYTDGVLILLILLLISIILLLLLRIARGVTKRSDTKSVELTNSQNLFYETDEAERNIILVITIVVIWVVDVCLNNCRAKERCAQSLTCRSTECQQRITDGIGLLGVVGGHNRLEQKHAAVSAR